MLDQSLNPSRKKKRLPSRFFIVLAAPFHPIHCVYISSPQHLILILISLVVNDVVEAELVDALGGRDDTEPVAKLLLLEELLCPIAP